MCIYLYVYIYILNIDTLWGLQYETMAITGCTELCTTTAHSGTRRHVAPATCLVIKWPKWIRSLLAMTVDSGVHLSFYRRENSKHTIL